MKVRLKMGAIKVFDNIKVLIETAKYIIIGTLVTDDIDVKKYYIKPSNAYITNIRLYNISNTEIDKQLTDLVSYNIRNNSNAIINDSADTYLNKEYKGRQR
jgi:nicotinic acid mononucleotide adenylyltransferase